MRLNISNNKKASGFLFFAYFTTINSIFKIIKKLILTSHINELFNFENVRINIMEGNIFYFQVTFFLKKLKKKYTKVNIQNQHEKLNKKNKKRKKVNFFFLNVVKSAF